MNRFIRVQLVSVLGSGADYGLTICLASGLHWPYLLANLSGNILGGSIQFFFCRLWVFKAGQGKMGVQAYRFILYFLGNILLSAAGVYFFTRFLSMNYILSKTITSVLLGTTYAYYAQKKFVFAV